MSGAAGGCPSASRAALPFSVAKDDTALVPLSPSAAARGVRASCFQTVQTLRRCLAC